MKNRKKSIKKAIMIQEAKQMRKKCEKMRKNPKNDPNMAPRSPQEEGRHFNGDLRVPLPADHLSWEIQVRVLWYTIPHAGGRTPAHCDASRISAGVLFRSYQAFPKSVQYLLIRSQILPKSFPNIPQILPKPSQNLTKSMQD